MFVAFFLLYFHLFVLFTRFIFAFCFVFLRFFPRSVQRNLLTGKSSHRCRSGTGKKTKQNNKANGVAFAFSVAFVLHFVFRVFMFHKKYSIWCLAMYGCHCSTHIYRLQTLKQRNAYNCTCVEGVCYYSSRAHTKKTPSPSSSFSLRSPPLDWLPKNCCPHEIGWLSSGPLLNNLLPPSAPPHPSG